MRGIQNITPELANQPPFRFLPRKGQAIYRQLGWSGFGLSRVATTTDWTATVVHWSGLTPGGNAAVVGGVDILDRVFASIGE